MDSGHCFRSELYPCKRRSPKPDHKIIKLVILILNSFSDTVSAADALDWSYIYDRVYITPVTAFGVWSFRDSGGLS